MSADKRIIVPGTDHPQTLAKVLENFASSQRVCTLIVRRGERFLLKIVEVRKELVIGEVRCLNWSPDQGRAIYRRFKEDGFSGEQRREVLLADAIDALGTQAHRYRVYIPLEDVTAVYEDLDDRFDETPFLPLP
jgi:hypothetical protein